MAAQAAYQARCQCFDLILSLCSCVCAFASIVCVLQLPSAGLLYDKPVFLLFCLVQDQCLGVVPPIVDVDMRQLVPN